MSSKIREIDKHVLYTFQKAENLIDAKAEEIRASIKQINEEAAENE